MEGNFKQNKKKKKSHKATIGDSVAWIVFTIHLREIKTISGDDQTRKRDT